MAGDRNTQRSPLFPLAAQYQLRETLFATKLPAPVFTQLALTSGSGFVLSGSNAEGRIGMLVHNITDFNDAQWVGIGNTEAAVMAGSGTGERLWGRMTTGQHRPGLWLPVAGGPSGTSLFAASVGATQTIVITEY
jgi:hypothetical protein